MNDNELPEYQIFTVLKQGEEEPGGPYSQNQIVELLNDGTISRDDLVFYEGIENWVPLKEVFDIQEGIANFEDDGQDQGVVAAVFSELTKLLAPDENIYYIAVQDRQGIHIKAPDAVAVTDYRLCVSHAKMGKKREFEIYPWGDVRKTDTRKNSGESTGAFTFLLESGERLEVNRLPRIQLNKLAQLSSELRGDDDQSGEESES